MVNQYVDGIEALNRKLKALETGGSKKVGRAAMVGAVSPARSAIRRGVNGRTATTEVKRAARLTIGSKIARRVDGQYMAKVGFGVGKPSAKKRTAAHERAVYGQGGAKLAGGIGLSSRNIHWFVLGTQERQTKTPERATGKIRPVLEGVVPIAINAARGQMISEAARRAAVALRKEAQKA